MSESTSFPNCSTFSDSVMISLIIPCYNVPENQVALALESVRKQTFHDYEVIIVDDGSSKEYSEVLQRLCAESKNIRLIQTENRGVSAARNTGIAHAGGKFIAFLDADDVLADDFMERALQAAAETDADFVIGGMSIVTESPAEYKTPVRSSLPQYEQFTFETFASLIPKLIAVKDRIYFPGGYISRGPCARLIRTELAKNNLFDETLRIGEDIPWNLTLLGQCHRVCVVRESWYGYWKNPNSASRRYDPGFIDACEKQLKTVASVIDASDDLIYCAYADRIYEHLYMSWGSCLRTEKKRNPEAYRTAVKRLYSCFPWCEVGSKRYYASVGSKRKLLIILYKLRLYYAVMAAKELCSLN